MEILDIYDKDRIKSGKTIVRGTKLGCGEYFLIVNVCVINSSNEMLIQKRDENKRSWPGFWDFTAAGAVSSGETSNESARRELLEEIGLEKDFSNERPKLTLPFDGVFADYYIFSKDIKIEDLTIQKDEVADIRWASKYMIYKMIGNGEFIPYHKELVDLIFVMKDNPGPRPQRY